MVKEVEIIDKTKNTKQEKTLKGVVVSDSMDKTVVVLITRHLKHPRYHKFMIRRKKIKAHDPENAYKRGDIVIIKASRPFSKEKSFLVIGKE